VQHEEFAKRAAERLEAIAKAIEDEERRIGRGEVSARANEMRVAARVVRGASETVTRRGNRQYVGRRSPLEVPS
jgi:hypothetical protein